MALTSTRGSPAQPNFHDKSQCQCSNDTRPPYQRHPSLVNYGAVSCTARPPQGSTFLDSNFVRINSPLFVGPRDGEGGPECADYQKYGGQP